MTEVPLYRRLSLHAPSCASILCFSLDPVEKQDTTTSYSIDISLKTDLSINDKFMQH
jgi:hypothetical protein